MDSELARTTVAGLYEKARESWGGATVSRLGFTLPDDTDGYAVTVKPKGMATIRIPDDSPLSVFASAWGRAQEEFFPVADFVGIFHDDTLHSIDFDPVAVVATREEVDRLAEKYPVVGGAYEFASGNGYWPRVPALA